MLATILLATFLSSIFSLIGAFVLSFKSHWTQPFALHMTAFSSGVLLYTSILHLIPEALEMAEETGHTTGIFSSVFLAVLIFFMMERMVLWYHHHHEAHDVKPTAWLITIGDTLHNFVDGVAVASALMLNPALGVITIIAVGAHEIPQEIADFAVMVNGGMTKQRALLLNLLSAMSAFAGALLAYALQTTIHPFLPLIMAFSAGMFLYIALSDLIPELHHGTHHNHDKWIQMGWFLGGIALLMVVTRVVEG